MQSIVDLWQFWVALSGLISVFTTVLITVYKKYIKPVKNGLVAMLRSQIVQQYNHYMDLGYCPIYAKENVEDLYLEYHALGGNGTITKLYQELLDLPTKKIGE